MFGIINSGGIPTEFFQDYLNEIEHFNMTRKFKPGTKVRIIANINELTDQLKGQVPNNTYAYLLAEKLLESEVIVKAATELIDNGSLKTYYTIACDIYDSSWYYLIPESFLFSIVD